MPLIQLNYPSVPNPRGAILNITNAQFPGAQDLRWNYEQVENWWIGARHYTNTLRVETSSAYVGPIQIGQFLVGIGAVQGANYFFPLPEYGPKAVFTGLPTEMDTGSFLHTIDFKQETEDGKQWLCTLEYGPFDIGHELGETKDGSVNPLNKPPDVTWNAEIYEEPFTQDITGQPYINTVGDPLLNPPKREQSRQTLRFIRNEQTYVEQWANTFRCSCNAAPFLGFYPYQVKCKNITGNRIYTADYGYYWEVSYEFEFRVITINNPDGTTSIYGWEDLVMNTGMRSAQLVPGSSSPLRQVLPVIIGGIPVTSPVALTQDGGLINSKWNITQTGNTLPFYLAFQNFPIQDFDFLNIPQNIFTINQ